MGASAAACSTPASADTTSVLVVAVVVFAALALADSWSDVRESLRRISALDLAVAIAAALGSTWASFRAWRTLLHGLHAELPPSDSRTMFFCSQVGKYAPGSVWPALIQTEIGARSRVPRAAVFTSYAFALLASVGLGGLVSAGVWSRHTSAWVALAVAGAVAGGVVLCIAFAHPSGFQRLWRRVLRGRESVQQLQPLPAGTALTALLWGLLGWALLGVHAWVLARPLGADAGDVVFVAGAYALAWVAGVVAVPLPAGAGLREFVLVVTLGRLIGDPAAISVALVSRLVVVVDDVALALATGLPAVLRQVRGRRPAPDTAE